MVSSHLNNVNGMSAAQFHIFVTLRAQHLAA
jgi:hypothetical protein